MLSDLCANAIHVHDIMAKEEARGDEVDAAAAAAAPRSTVTYTRRKRKRKRTGGASGSRPAAATVVGAGMCDDVLRGIFARVPARTAVASMALSRHHQALLRCPEFRALHCRLAPPLPDPHVAYIAMAKVRRSGENVAAGEKQPVSGYHGFHVAGAGLRGRARAPMRALAGPTCPRMRYVSTCHGVVLLVVKARPATCVLWNPAIADAEEEVRVPVSDDEDCACAVLGLGYGRRSQSYKLLLSRRRQVTSSSSRRDPKPNELLVYALGGAVGGGEQPRLRTLLSEGLDGEISDESLYVDGMIYILHVDKKVILAVDVDDETVTAIDLPGEHGCKIMSTTVLFVSGRPCVGTQDSHGRAVWLLTVEHQWEQKCVISDKAPGDDRLYRYYSIAGVWDCGGVLFMYLRNKDYYEDRDDKLCMYSSATKKTIEVNLPRKLAPPEWVYTMCWGYKPTLVSPRSVVVTGEVISQDEEEGRAWTADVMAALAPLNERDRRKGHRATLHTVCFMEFLFGIMQKLLPENMSRVAEIPLLKPEDSGKELYYSDSDGSDDGFEDRFMSCYKKARRTLIPY